MSRQSAPKELAKRLAEAAWRIRSTHGDEAAQVAVYEALLSRWQSRACDTPDCIPEGCDVGPTAEWYKSRGMEPQVYFYEEFLRAYDPAGARKRGVHYTPPAVVDFMVRGVEWLLAQHFGQLLSDAMVLDPCCGVGTFLRRVRRHCQNSPQMTGLELSPAACLIARRLVPEADIIHADGLEDADLMRDGKTLVVIGNPPYSGHSANPGKIAHLMADYRDAGSERNPKWLQDDYVKFIRSAQDRIEQAGGGIVALITNHSYLFNPTFRAMRRSLLSSFDQVCAVDLYGNAKLRATAEIDENVFPIQMGVAISFFVRTGRDASNRVCYAGIKGTREQKLQTLAAADPATLAWQEIYPAPPFHLMVPHSTSLAAHYYAFPSITELFRESSVGFVTSRDRFAIDSDRDSLLARIGRLRDGRLTPDEAAAAGDLDLRKARQALKSDPNWRDRAVLVHYRPYDRRWAYLAREIMERPRLPFMEHLLRDNVSICVGRAGQATGSAQWDVVFCSDCPVDLNLFRRGGAMVFPRFVYDSNERRSNLLTDESDHDDLFYYIYALLHSRSYRTRYADFLRIDYPRIPLDPGMVNRLAPLGRRLLEVHLLRADTMPGDDPHPVTIGGYEYPNKYLNERKSRPLTEHEAQTFARIQAALSAAEKIRKEIDEVEI